MRFVKILAVNLLLLILLLVLFEWVLEQVNPYERHHSVLGRYIHLREVALPNTQLTEKPHPIFEAYTENLAIKKYRITVDSFGFIQSPSNKSDASTNIVFLGGSTTACRYVEENFRFPALVGEKFRAAGVAVNTFNAGVAGSHSMHSLNVLTNKILHHQFDVVVLMHGINDLVHLSYNGSYLKDDKTPRRRNLVTMAKPAFDEPDFYYFRKKGMKLRFEKVFQVLFPRLHYELLATKVKVINQQEPLEFGWEKMQPIGPEQFVEFKNNIKSFVALCRANTIEPVLMTQFNRITEEAFLSNPVFEAYTEKLNHSKTSVQAFCKDYQLINEIVREVAKEEAVWLIDLDQLVPQTNDYLYDMVHLHKGGSQSVAEIIFSSLENKLNK